MGNKLGTINGFVLSTAWLNDKKFHFDGTTLGLVRSAISNGAKIGDKVLANYGGRLKSNARTMTIVHAPKDYRASEMWAE